MLKGKSSSIFFQPGDSGETNTNYISSELHSLQHFSLLFTSWPSIPIRFYTVESA
jgi:hypothetical protein